MMIDEDFELSEAGKQTNRISPLLKLGKPVHVKAVTVKIQGSQQLPN